MEGGTGQMAQKRNHPCMWHSPSIRASASAWSIARGNKKRYGLTRTSLANPHLFNYLIRNSIGTPYSSLHPYPKLD